MSNHKHHNVPTETSSHTLYFKNEMEQSLLIGEEVELKMIQRAVIQILIVIPTPSAVLIAIHLMICNTIHLRSLPYRA